MQHHLPLYVVSQAYAELLASFAQATTSWRWLLLSPAEWGLLGSAEEGQGRRRRGQAGQEKTEGRFSPRREKTKDFGKHNARATLLSHGPWEQGVCRCL